MSVSVYTPENKMIHETYVDFISRYIGKPVHVVQGDKELPIVAVKLYSRGVVTSINDIIAAASTAFINVRCRDKKGNMVYSPALGINESGNIIFFEVSENMTNESGIVHVIVELICNGSVAQSSEVILDVDRNPVWNYKEPQGGGVSFKVIKQPTKIVDYEEVT